MSFGRSWWRHQMETFSALLAICAGNSPVPGEFPTQRPVTRSFDVSFDLHLNKRLSKQRRGWWFETLSRPLWRHRNVMLYCTSPLPDRWLMNFIWTYVYYTANGHEDVIKMEIFSALLVLCEGNSLILDEFPSLRPVTRSFEFFMCLNKRLSKNSRGWWFETPSRSLWLHCNGHSIFVWPTFFVTGNSTKHGLSKGTSSSSFIFLSYLESEDMISMIDANDIMKVCIYMNIYILNVAGFLSL